MTTERAGEGPALTEQLGLVERLRKERVVTRWMRGMDTDYPAEWAPNPLCHEAAAEIERLRKDAALLAWVLAHPETAAECLEDAAAGDGTARNNLERRIAGLTQKNAGGRLGAA